MTDTAKPPLLATLHGARLDRPPVWFMRQAGRHLPEYLETRARARDFLDFCYSPALAAEATLQPVRRYGMDGAILFADILLILDALGRGVRFEKGVGPLVEKIEGASDLSSVSPCAAADRLSPVYETVRRVRAALSPEQTLIGFAGAPWTVAVYAVEGRGKTERQDVKVMAHRDPEGTAAILDTLVEATALYMSAQVEAGAQALMIFDTWAEGLPNDVFRRVIIEPTAKLVARLRELGCGVPIIGFPKGAGAMIGPYVEATGVTALGLGTETSPEHVAAALPSSVPVQGHLDPLLLLAGGSALERRVEELVAAYADRPHVFNLGHGVLPETPIAHVERAVAAVRGTAG